MKFSARNTERGATKSVKILTVLFLLVCFKDAAHSRDSHLFVLLIPAERLFYVDYDNDVNSAYMVLVYVTKAGPFFFFFFFAAILSTLSTQQPEDKLTDTFTLPVNNVNKTLVQTCLRRTLSL